MQQASFNNSALGTLPLDTSYSTFYTASSGGSDLRTITQPIAQQNWKSYAKDRDVTSEFTMLKKMFQTNHHQDRLFAYDPIISKLNRYVDIIPYTDSAVKLHCNSNELKDQYINANIVYDPYTSQPKSPESNEATFIATQGPLQNTSEAFWRMMWQSQATVIIMLCGLSEHGRVSCHVYWPEKGSVNYGDLSITLTQVETPNKFYWVRSFQLTNLMTKESRTVRQYHSVGWPDRKIPDSKDWKNLMTLIKSCEQEFDLNHKPLVIHCSAGIGRTGTLMSLLYLIRSLKQTQAATVFGTVRALREQRPFCVQTVEQYEFIYKFIHEFIKGSFN